MRRKSLACFAVLAAVVSTVPGRAAPVGPVVNGGFEIAAPGKQVACDTVGSDTWIDVLPNHDPWLARVHPCEAGAVKAAQWSSSRVTQFGDVDEDGDREALIDGSLPADEGIGSSHNFWQAYPNPHQAYTADFDALRFRVEAGTIPPGAIVQLSLSTSPLAAPSPFVGIFLNCSLTFSRLTPDTGGLVSADPVEASFASRHVDCDASAAAWAAGGEDERRAALGTLRIVQVSFWGFEAGSPVVLDDVEIAGARTVPEQLLGIRL